MIKIGDKVRVAASHYVPGKINADGLYHGDATVHADPKLFPAFDVVVVDVIAHSRPARYLVEDVNKDVWIRHADELSLA